MLRFIGAECFCLIASATVQRWFVRLRGRATSVLALNGIVLIQMPVFMSLLIDALGWRKSYVALAIALGALLGVALLLIRSEPASMGLLPDGGVAEGAHESACNGGKSRGCDGGGGDGQCGGGSGSGCASSAPPLSSATLRAASKHPLFWCLASLNLFNDIFWAGFNYHYIATVRWFGGALRESSELTLTRVASRAEGCTSSPVGQANGYHGGVSSLMPATGAPYGSISAPTTAGSSFSCSGSPGGAVAVSARQTIVVDSLDVSGDPGLTGRQNDGRGGAGGSVWLAAPVVSVVNFASANGAPGTFGNAGGGRVVVAQSGDPLMVRPFLSASRGGSDATAGSVSTPVYLPQLVSDAGLLNPGVLLP
jgi:hypothetical protein